MCWLQLLRYDDLMLYFVIYESKLSIFRFWTVGFTKKDVTLDSDIIRVIFYYLVTFYRIST